MAELTKPQQGAIQDDGIARLEEDGLLTKRGKKNIGALYPDLAAVAPKTSALDLLDEMRGGR